jgi:hypothetical protein
MREHLLTHYRVAATYQTVVDLTVFDLTVLEAGPRDPMR